MTEQVPTSLRPNVLAALPGRMVDEAPKRHGVADKGAREAKFTPTIFGLLGGAIMAFFLVWYDVLTVLLDGEGVMLYFGLFGLVGAMFVGMAAGFGGYTYLNLRTRSYTLYDGRVEMREGFLRQESRMVPYNHVTNVKLRQNVWERFLDAGTIQLQTAGSKDFELWIRGIDNPEETADRIRENVQQASEPEVGADA